MVERDQIKIELTETQKRLKKFLDEMNEKIRLEKENAEKIFEEKSKENTEKASSISLETILHRCFLRFGKRKNGVHSMN